MEFTEDFTHSHKTCFQCNGYYGPNFCQPLCSTCHAFLYPDDASNLPSVGPYQEKIDDGDSGNEEPREPGDYYQSQEQLQQEPPQQRLHHQHFQLQQLEQQLQQQQEGTTNNNESDDFDFVEGVGVEGCVETATGVNQAFFSSVEPYSASLPAGRAVSATGGGGGGGGQAGICLPSGSVVSMAGGACGGAVAGVSGSSNGLMAVSGTSGVSSRDGGAGGGSVRVASVRNCEGRSMVREALQEQITQLTCPHPHEHLDPTLIHRMPPEVWVLVFDLLDDMTLWSVGRVCRRWQQLVDRYVTDDQWQRYTQRRWPLYSPLFKDVPWQLVYTKLTESAPCHMCLHQMSLLTPPFNNENSWRRNRLRNELRTLRSDPPEGIQASPLDKLSLHWQASIRGPAGSPYEGGTFFLYIQIPHSYPLCPPIVHFITKIFHPNVSRHGDIGIDSIQHNWSLALTISKVLISIQSLLTDPYTKVCMEPDIGRLYEVDKRQFECVARSWTWQHGMHDALRPEPVPAPASTLPSAPPPGLTPPRSTLCASSAQVESEDGGSASGSGLDSDNRLPYLPT